MNINKYASTMSVMIKSLYLQLITRKENFMIGNVFREPSHNNTDNIWFFNHYISTEIIKFRE